MLPARTKYSPEKLRLKSSLAFLQIDLFALDGPEKGFIGEYAALPAVVTLMRLR